MSMISELVKELRKLGNQWKHNDVAGFNLIFDAADTIETLSEKVRASNLHNGWIPVSEGLPKEGEPVLITDCGYVDGLAWVAKDGAWESDHAYTDSVTAWMPLPKPYKGGDEA